MYHSRIFIHPLKTIQQLPLNFFLLENNITNAIKNNNENTTHKNYHNKTTTQKLIIEKWNEFFSHGLAKFFIKKVFFFVLPVPQNTFFCASLRKRFALLLKTKNKKKYKHWNYGIIAKQKQKTAVFPGTQTNLIILKIRNNKSWSFYVWVF